MKNMKNTITAPRFIHTAIFDTFDRLFAQLDAIGDDGKPVLNSKTKAKLIALRPIVDAVRAGKKLATAEGVAALECLHVSTAMTAKLAGINACSTASSANPICKARACNKNSICSNCFAFLTFERYGDLEQAAIINFIILNLAVYSAAAWKQIPIPTSNGMFRIEAFGDVGSAVQAANYILLAKAHRYLMNIGVWSKNLGFWAVAFNAYGKPANIVFNASSPIMNERVEIKPEYMWFIDHVFTVYTAAHALENSVDINCGDRTCANCRRCYTKGNGVEVSEILKAESKKYYKAIGKEFTRRK